MSQFMRGPKVQKINRSRKDFLYLALAAVVLVIPLLLITAKQSRLVNVGYRINELRDETAALKQEQVKLRAELASLTSPDRVLNLALEQGLMPIDEQHRFEVQNLGGQPVSPDKDSELMVARTDRD